METIDLDEWRQVRVTGADALDWLDDLISAGLSGADGPRRSLLLTPTGRIRAEFHVVSHNEEFLLVQDPIQPKSIDDLLAPYVLSSNVMLARIEDHLVATWSDDVLTPMGPTDGRLDLAVFDEWRIHEGIPRFGVDLDEDSLPQEAGWERFIDFTKGCFMGQEAMAKIRNMGGHPTRVVKAMHAKDPLIGGEALLADGDEVGLVTSAAGTDVIVRVSWSARGSALRTPDGVELLDRP